MLGNNEARQLRQLLDEIEARLSPPNPVELSDRAHRIIDLTVRLKWAQEALAAVETEDEI
jgi:hypothetical protein